METKSERKDLLETQIDELNQSISTKLHVLAEKVERPLKAFSDAGETVKHRVQKWDHDLDEFKTDMKKDFQEKPWHFVLGGAVVGLIWGAWPFLKREIL